MTDSSKLIEMSNDAAKYHKTCQNIFTAAGNERPQDRSDFDTLRTITERIITTAQELEGGYREKVWVFTVTDDDAPQPAVYVSDTEAGVWSAMMAGQGIPDHFDSDDAYEWFEKHHKVTSCDSYYVEMGL